MPSSPRLGFLRKAGRLVLLGKLGVNAWKTRNDISTDTQDFANKVYRVTEGHWMFRTSSGLVGLGPALAQRNDEVFLIKGCRTPLVLQPTVPQLATWRLVGDCYVHGVMHGELFVEEKCRGVWLV